MTTWSNRSPTTPLEVVVSFQVPGKGGKTATQSVTHAVPPGAKFTYDETAANGSAIAAQLVQLADAI